MLNEVTIQGRIIQNIKVMRGSEGPNADFAIRHRDSEFQIICYSEIAYGFDLDDNVIITGRLCEVGGDCHVAADSIALDAQGEFKF
jgi:hypothetical protein